MPVEDLRQELARQLLSTPNRHVRIISDDADIIGDMRNAGVNQVANVVVYAADSTYFNQLSWHLSTAANYSTHIVANGCYSPAPNSIEIGVIQIKYHSNLVGAIDSVIFTLITDDGAQTEPFSFAR